MNENDEKTIKALDEQLSKARKIIKKKSFICSMYLLKYIYDKNQDAYNNFLRIFNTLSTEEKFKRTW